MLIYGPVSIIVLKFLLLYGNIFIHSMNEWMNEWMNECMHDPMNEWWNELINDGMNEYFFILPANCLSGENITYDKILMILKGNMHMISPDRTRFYCQILAYLVTIHLLYGTRCLSYWFC